MGDPEGVQAMVQSAPDTSADRDGVQAMRDAPGSSDDHESLPAMQDASGQSDRAGGASPSGVADGTAPPSFGEPPGPEESWGQRLGTTGAVGPVVDAEGHLVVALHDREGGGPTRIERFDLEGHRTGGEEVDFEVAGLAALPDGGLVVTGGPVARLDGDEVVWTTDLPIESEGDTEFRLDGRLVAADAHGVWVAGQAQGTFKVPNVPNPTAVQRVFIARLDPAGSLLWHRVLGDNSVYLTGLARGADSGAVLAIRLNGASLEIAGERHEHARIASLLIGFAPDGEALFSRAVGESDDDSIESLTRNGDGELYVAGNRPSYGVTTTSRTFVATASVEGTVDLRATVAEGTQMDGALAVPSPGGGLILASRYSGPEESGLLLVDFDAQGEEGGRHKFPKGYAYASGMVALSDGGLILVGQMQGAIALGPIQLETDRAYDSFIVRLYPFDP